MPVALVTRNQKLSQETVDILRDYLAMAERGDIVAVAICALEPNNSAIHQASSCDNQVLLVGAITRLLHRMHLNADSKTEE